MDSKLFTMLQLCDSAFPTGGFSHSMGAEAAIGNFYIQQKDDLMPFIVGSLENVGSLVLPFVKAAHRNCNSFDDIQALDALLNVYLSNHVARHSSLQQGETLLSAAVQAFNLSQLEEIQELLDSRKICGHQAIVFGVVCAHLGIKLHQTAEMFMFVGLRTLLASLVRLGKVGAIEAQKLQFELGKCLDKIVSSNWDVDPKDASLRFPILDAIQMSHDTLFSKLFIS